MNGKNIYNGDINSSPTFVPNKPNNNISNQKYIATIVSENLQKSSLDKNFDQQTALNEREIAKAKQNAKRSNKLDKKVSKESDELLKVAVNYDDYDFNEWNRKIVDAYNPYAIDDLSNTTLTNYEKIKRIVSNEHNAEKNLNDFESKLDDIYDDIKDKITNETLKIIYGEDNFEYVPNKLSTYQKDWSTGDDEVDMLLKLYHSPKIKQRDISANDYIAQRYANFAKTIDGKQSFEVSSAKTGVNPNDVVRVHLDKAYYMNDEALRNNKNLQNDYIKSIIEKGAVKQPDGVNRFGAKPNAIPSSRPMPPQTPNQVSNANNENVFVPQNSETDTISQISSNRTVPRREEWVSQNALNQQAAIADAIKKWEKLERYRNTKLEEFIIENGLVINEITKNMENDKEKIVLKSVIFTDPNKENLKINMIQKFAKKNKFDCTIDNDEANKEQTITFEFKFIDYLENELGEQNNNSSSTSDNKVTNLAELEASLNEDIFENYELSNNDFAYQAIDDIFDSEDKQNESSNKQISNTNKQKRSNDNIEGIGGMSRMTANSFSIPKKRTSQFSTNEKSYTKINHHDDHFERILGDKPKSLADVLAEKRNKNHRQMYEARINKKISLQEAIDKINSDNTIYHGPKKKR